MKKALLGCCLALTSCFGAAPLEAQSSGPSGQSPTGKAAGPKIASGLTPIWGGTVTLTNQGRFAVVSDADRDRVTIIDLDTKLVRSSLQLPRGSKPWRSIQDGNGDLRVVLRGAGELATVSLGSARLLRSQTICAEPRGLTYDKSIGAVRVACAGGELIAIPDKGSSSTRQLNTPDLRDLVMLKGVPYVTTFRQAAMVKVSDPTQQLSPPQVELGNGSRYVPQVAYRTFEVGERVVMVHQRHVEGDISAIAAGGPPTGAVPYYVNWCQSAVVRSAVTVFDEGRIVSSFDMPGVLPVDADVSADGQHLAIAAPGTLQVVETSLPTEGVTGGICNTPSAVVGGPTSVEDDRPVSKFGQPVGVRFRPDGSLVVHSRDPAQVTIVDTQGGTTVVPLEATRVDSPGHRLFHTAPSAIACASCHAEGLDDGHVWKLEGHDRRTQPLNGNALNHAPFHWGGELASVDALLGDTFVRKMGGVRPAVEIADSLKSFLLTVPEAKGSALVPAPTLAKGQALFAVSCASCHEAQVHQPMSVGTGANFKVPSLRGVRLRAPYMHDGCAKTLADRFDLKCGGAAHPGSQLPPDDQAALVGYLESL